jgi:hypothetical protein
MKLFIWLRREIYVFWKCFRLKCELLGGLTVLDFSIVGRKPEEEQDKTRLNMDLTPGIC